MINSEEESPLPSDNENEFSDLFQPVETQSEPLRRVSSFISLRRIVRPPITIFQKSQPKPPTAKRSHSVLTLIASRYGESQESQINEEIFLSSSEDASTSSKFNTGIRSYINHVHTQTRKEDFIIRQASSLDDINGRSLYSETSDEYGKLSLSTSGEGGNSSRHGYDFDPAEMYQPGFYFPLMHSPSDINESLGVTNLFRGNLNVPFKRYRHSVGEIRLPKPEPEPQMKVLFECLSHQYSSSCLLEEEDLDSREDPIWTEWCKRLDSYTPSHAKPEPPTPTGERDGTNNNKQRQLEPTVPTVTPSQMRAIIQRYWKN